MKKIFKYLSILFFIFGFFLIYELTSLSTKIINRDFISIDLNNVRNPQVKKITRYLNDVYSTFLISFSDRSKEYYSIKDDRDNLPDEIIINKTEIFSENLYPTENNGKSWKRNYGSSASNRFSKLKIIKKNNLKNLDVAWKYEIKDKPKNDIQSNVLVAEGKIFIPSNNKKIIALNAKTGEHIWELKLDSNSPRRGMLYLDSLNEQPSKIIFSSYKKLISINASNGKFIKNFGKNGIVELKRPSITSPAVFKNNLIITTSEPSVEVYDLNTGKLSWKFLLMEKETKEKGIKKHDYSGGNPWGGFSLDEVRGIVYITTGNAGRYFNGVNRPGRNKFANSIIAIDLKNTLGFSRSQA